MILATVGSEQQPFNRLMTWIEALILRGFISPDEVILHFGDSTYVPARVRCYQSMNQARFQELSAEATLIISHCSEAALIRLDSTRKPYLLVPRTQSYKEHSNDEQIELALALAQMGVPIAWSPGDVVRFLASPHRISLSTIYAAADRNLYKRLKACAAKKPALKLKRSSSPPAS